MIDYSQAIMIIVAIFVLNAPIYYNLGKINTKVKSCEQQLKKLNGVK